MASSNVVADAMTGLVFVALATTLVAHKNTASDVTAAGNAFSTTIKATTAGGRDLPNLRDLPSR